MEASDDETGVGVAILVVLALLDEPAGLDLEWKYFFQIMQDNGFDIVRENIFIVALVLLIGWSLTFQKRVIKYEIIGYWVPRNGIGGNVW